MSELDYARECGPEPEPAEDERVKEIRERLSRISPWPWTWEPVGEFDGEASNAGGFRYQHIRSGYKGIADTYHASGMQCPDGSVIEPRDGNKDDADFIAHAPADIDYLLSLLPVQPAASTPTLSYCECDGADNGTTSAAGLYYCPFCTRPIKPIRKIPTNASTPTEHDELAEGVAKK